MSAAPEPANRLVYVGMRPIPLQENGQKRHAQRKTLDRTGRVAKSRRVVAEPRSALEVSIQEQLEERSNRRIIDAFRRRHELTHLDLMRETGLSRGTITSVVRQLEKGRLIEPARRRGRGTTSARGGRPPSLLRLNDEAGVAVGIDFGQRHIRLALGSLAGGIHEETPEALDLPVDEPPHARIDLAAELAANALADAGMSPEQVIGVSVGVPGPVDRNRGVIASHSIMSDWRGVRFADELRRRLRWPANFLIENDANLGALAELEHGAARGYTNVLYVKWSTGIGAGFILDGELQTGVRGIAGEFGHTPVPLLPGEIRALGYEDNEGFDIGMVRPTCGLCRISGCVARMAAGHVLAGNAGVRTFDELVARAKADDADCVAVLQTASRYVGAALGPLVTVLNPELIVLGGAFDEDAYRIVAGGLRDGLIQNTLPAAFDDVELSTGICVGKAAAVGAVVLALRSELTNWVGRRLIATG